MNELELRLRVQGMVQQWVESFMYNNGVSASMMEDALNKTLVFIKDKVCQEFIDAVTDIQPEVSQENQKNEEE